MTADLVPARPATPDEFRQVVERISEKTGKRLKSKVVNHPAVAFGDKAEAAGWRVEYRVARGPLTVRHRPDEPNEAGKLALVSVTRTVESIGVRAAHPDGRRLAAWWVGSGDDATFGEGWAASPRRNVRPLLITALTNYLTEIEIVEEETVGENETGERRARIEEDAREVFDTSGGEHGLAERDAFVQGYVCGVASATESTGDAYGEGYAAGLAAALGHPRVWVPAQKRLGALIAGDVILGKGARWWVVGAVGGDIGRANAQATVVAHSGPESVTVSGPAARKVDVVEPIATADALAALRELGATPIRGDVPA